LPLGGGIKGGTYGESDHWGYKPLDRNRLTDVHGHVLRQMLG